MTGVSSATYVADLFVADALHLGPRPPLGGVLLEERDQLLRVALAVVERPAVQADGVARHGGARPLRGRDAGLVGPDGRREGVVPGRRDRLDRQLLGLGLVVTRERDDRDDRAEPDDDHQQHDGEGLPRDLESPAPRARGLRGTAAAALMVAALKVAAPPAAAALASSLASRHNPTVTVPR